MTKEELVKLLYENGWFYIAKAVNLNNYKTLNRMAKDYMASEKEIAIVIQNYLRIQKLKQYD